MGKRNHSTSHEHEDEHSPSIKKKSPRHRRGKSRRVAKGRSRARRTSKKRTTRPRRVKQVETTVHHDQ